MLTSRYGVQCRTTGLKYRFAHQVSGNIQDVISHLGYNRNTGVCGIRISTHFVKHPSIVSSSSSMHCGSVWEDRIHEVGECPLYEKKRENYMNKLGKWKDVMERLVNPVIAVSGK